MGRVSANTGGSAQPAQPKHNLDNPALLEEPEYATLSAAWYWHIRKINEPADAGDFRDVTKRINPGLLGYNQRLAYYKLATRCIGQ